MGNAACVGKHFLHDLDDFSAMDFRAGLEVCEIAYILYLLEF